MNAIFFRWTSANYQKKTRIGYGTDERGQWFKLVEKEGQQQARVIKETQVPDAVLKEYDQLAIFGAGY